MPAARRSRPAPAIGWGAWTLRVVVLAVVFGGSDAISSLTSAPGSGIAGIWVPGGIALAGLLLGGISLWPSLVIGGLAAAPAYGVIGASTVPVVLANTAAVVVAAWAIRRLGTNLRLGRIGDVARFMLGSLVGALPMGAVGVASLIALGPAEKGPLGSVVSLWLLSTATGFVVVGAAITVLWSRRDDAPQAARLVEAIGGLVLVAALSYAVFVDEWGGLSLLLLLAASVTAARGGPRAAALASLIVFSSAASAVLTGGGPFGGDTVTSRSLTYQTAVLVMAVGMQGLGALGSRESGAAPGRPGTLLAIGLLGAGGLALGVAEGIVTPEVILLAPKPQVTLISLLMGLVVVVGAIAGTGAGGHAQALRRADGRWWAFGVLAGVALFGTEELFLMSLATIDVTRAVVLASLAPVILLIVAMARRQVPVSAAVVGSIVVVILGFYAIAPGEGWLSGFEEAGVWFGLGSSVSAAVLLVALYECRRTAGTGPTVVVTFAVGALSAAVLCAATGTLPGPDVWGREDIMGSVLYVGIVGTLVPVVLATWAVPVLGAAWVSLFEVLAPPIAVVAALAWGESTVGTWQALGIVLLLIGIALGARAHSGGHGDAAPAIGSAPGPP
ncbi:MAG: MASE1 domain-containing protein [Actinomycetota bacterium]